MVTKTAGMKWQQEDAMAKMSNQKAKILYLMRLFEEETDEEHPLSRKDLEERLADIGIHAERKSLYNDIETLKNFGLDIAYRKEQPEGYYLTGRDFELADGKEQKRGRGTGCGLLAGRHRPGLSAQPLRRKHRAQIYQRRAGSGSDHLYLFPFVFREIHPPS